MAKARCPVPVLRDVHEVEVEAARPWLRHHAQLSLAWRRWRDGEGQADDLVTPTEKEAVRPRATVNPLERLRWVAHWCITADGKTLCLKCGLGPAKAAARRCTFGGPCQGHRSLRAAAVIALRSGRYNVALQAALLAWREAAARAIDSLV